MHRVLVSRLARQCTLPARALPLLRQFSSSRVARAITASTPAAAPGSKGRVVLLYR
jgi:hypothetical protein